MRVETSAFNRNEVSLTVQHFSVKFKRILMVIAIKWPFRNLHDFVQNFLVLSMHIFKIRIISESISNRTVITSAFKRNEVSLTHYILSV